MAEDIFIITILLAATVFCSVVVMVLSIWTVGTDRFYRHPVAVLLIGFLFALVTAAFGVTVIAEFMG